MSDDYHAHEALHVAHVLRNMVAHELSDHPFVLAHPDIAMRVEIVMNELGGLYQAIGAIHLAAPKGGQDYPAGPVGGPHVIDEPKGGA